ncbi:hypothetical protein Q1695_007840 [Nippostrongylus brasiliensis]|nr:hypothetical protein Q1695_007840 [Nippostrongylus brasiliensis]
MRKRAKIANNRPAGHCGFCQVRNAYQLERSTNCDLMDLDGDDEVMQHPDLYNKIKDVKRFVKFILIGTKLQNISIHNSIDVDSAFILINNKNLVKIPRVKFVKSFNTTVDGSPNLDTTQLINECDRRRCSREAKSRIQKPFSCDYRNPLPARCRNVVGSINVQLTDPAFQQIESLKGTLILQGSNLTKFPQMRNLKYLDQKGTKPVLIIQNNAQLRDLRALFKVEINADRDAVVFKNNPRICLTDEQIENELFILKFIASRASRCKVKSALHNFGITKTLLITIIAGAIIH